MSKKPYFPNNWRAFKDAPDEAFEHPDGPLSFNQFMEWRADGFELPSSVCCIIRENARDGKIKEYVYQRGSAAQKKMEQLLDSNVEFIVCDADHITHLEPTWKDDDDSTL